MDIVSSLNAAFTQVQRSETLNFGSNGNSTSVGFRQRETSSGATGLPGGRGGIPQQLSGPSNDSLSSAVQNAVAYDRTERGGLQLRTQEGDVVRLKFLNSESANAQGQQFESGGTTVSDFSMTGGSSSNFQVVVEGDLNGEELSAIRDVLIQAREMANTFFEGDVKEAFSMASQMDIDSDQLANVNMRLNVSETYTYAQTSLVAQSPQEPATQPTLPVPPTVESAPQAVAQVVAPVVTAPVNQSSNADLVATLSQQATVAGPSTGVPSVAKLAQEAPDTPEPLQTQVHSAPDPVGSLADVSATITSFLSQLTESINSFGQQPPQGLSAGNGPRSALSFSSGLQLQVVSSFINQMETDGAGQVSPAGALASKTIDELAMKMDAFIDARI